MIDPHGMDPGGSVVPSTAPYRQLAKQTGGLFLRSAPGDALLQDIGHVLEDMSGYYLIGYRPDRLDTAQRRQDIKVKVLRRGLEVRARNGYLGKPESDPPGAPKDAAAQLPEALSSPFRSGGLKLRIDPRYSASAPDPKTRLRSPLLHAGLLVDGAELKLADAGAGRKELVYTAVVTVAREDGAVAARAGRTFSVILTHEQEGELSAAGANPSLDIQLPGPGPYQIRAAVRDENSGEIGSAYEYLEVPDFNKGKITLSTIVSLRQVDPLIRELTVYRDFINNKTKGD